MAQFTIVLENTREHTAIIYNDGRDLTREEALSIIEERFESGYLTGERYRKTSVSTWQYSDYKILRLFSEKGLEEWLKKMQ